MLRNVSSAMSVDPVQPSRLRLHLEQRLGTFRTFAQVMFTAEDASLYLVPYAPRGEYYYGLQRLPAGEANVEVKFKEQLAATCTSTRTTRPRIRIGHVSEYRSEHIASVRCDRARMLPVHSRAPRITREQADVAFGLPDGRRSRRALHLRERRAQPVSDGAAALCAPRPLCRRRRRGGTGSASTPTTRWGRGTIAGVTVLAGFDARRSETDDQEFLFLRGL